MQDLLLYFYNADKSLKKINKILILIFILLSCSNIAKKELLLNLAKTDQIYFSVFKLPYDANTFESIHGINILKIIKEGDSFKVSATELIFITYAKKFLTNIKILLPESSLGQYKLIKTIKLGKILPSSVKDSPKKNSPLPLNQKDFILEFDQGVVIENEGASIENLLTITELNRNVFRPIYEKLLFQVTAENSLWLAISSEFSSDKNMLIWKNHRGSFLRPFTEFSSGVDKISNSSQYDYNSYSLKKLQIEKNRVRATIAFRSRKITAFYTLEPTKGNPEYITLNGKLLKNPDKILNQYIIINHYDKKHTSK